MEIPSLVIRYIGRYSKRACLSEYKITKMEEGYISFRYKDYKNLDVNKKPIENEMRLHYSDFFPLLLQHVPLPYFRIVRYYGIYSNRGSIPEEYLYRSTFESESGSQECCENEEESPFYCEGCKLKRVYCYTIIQKRGEDVEQARTIVYARSNWKNRMAA